MASSPTASRLHPARTFTISGAPAIGVEIATAALGAEGFRLRTVAGSNPAVLEYGGWWSEFFFGILFGLLPGPIGKHTLAVVEGQADAVTMSLVRGTRSNALVHRAIAETARELSARGILVADSGPIASDDLPATSPSSPAGFRRARRELGL